MKKITFITLLTLIIALVGCTGQEDEGTSTTSSSSAKPVIYLYPEEEMEVSVQLDYNGDLHYTYPTYEGGWEVVAYPDGTIFSDGQEYSYLFWDGFTDVEYDFSQGFVVAGSDTEEFLVEKLA